MTPESAAALERVLGRRDHLEQVIARVPEELIHGDCHLDNLLDDDGRLALTDWQSVRLGAGTDDLAFLLTKGITAATPPSRGLLVDAYATARGQPRDLVEAAVTACQLLVLALQFPEFEPWLDDRAKDALREAFVALTSQVA